MRVLVYHLFLVLVNTEKIKKQQLWAKLLCI